MSLASTIKDFVDVLNDISTNQIASTPEISSSLSNIINSDLSNTIKESTSTTISDLMRSIGTLPRTVVMQQAFFYTLKSLGNGLLYLLTFQWLRDFSYLPLLVPTEGRAVFFSGNNPIRHLFGLNNQQGFHLYYQVLAGFINSFFFSLPFSLPHLVSVRRLFSQGITAAAASIFGTVAAHSLLLIGVLYGVRFLIVPYHSLQPLTFGIGLFTTALLINEMVQDKKMYLAPLQDIPSLIRIGVLNFILALCEETTVFHSFHNLTLNAHTSYLQLSASSNFLNLFLNNTSYLVAFVLGHCIFSLTFCYLFLKGNEFLCSLSGWTLPKMARRINRIVLFAIVALTFSSFPYYGLDYIFTKIGGFLPEDPVLNRTIFSPTMVKSRGMHFKSTAPLIKNDKTPLELDLNYFDRGVYMNAPKEEKETLSFKKQENLNPDRPLTFEELNYQSEYAWLTREERTRRLPEEGEGKKDSLFQEPKNHFKKLRLQNEKKQAEAALKEKTAAGNISEWKEGLVPGAKLNKNDNLSSQATLELPSFSENKVSDKNDLLVTASGFEDKPNKSLTNDKGLFKNSYTKLYATQNPLLAPSMHEVRNKNLFPKFEEELAENYAKGFASSFPEELESTPFEFSPVENIIKKRYLLNPVYRALLKSDIDSFLARQPSSYNTAHNQEYSLFEKRQLLEKYYNWLRYYSPLESNIHRTKNTTDLFFAGTGIHNKVSQGHMQEQNQNLYKSDQANPTKSFVERVYHQQFKGTLYRAKRLFKVSFDSEQNPNKNRVLSYDQTLYKNPSQLYTEKKKQLNTSVQGKKRDRPFHVDQNPSLHEELFQEKISPLIEESTTSPIYAGWDDKAHKFVLTNRFFNF